MDGTEKHSLLNYFIPSWVLRSSWLKVTASAMVCTTAPGFLMH